MQIKKKLLFLIAMSTLLMLLLLGCGTNTKQTNSKAKKLQLTKENVKNFFQSDYDVEGIVFDWGGINGIFITKKNTNKKDAPNIIKSIQNKINDNFQVTDPYSSIKLYNNDHTFLGRTSNQNNITKIIIGYEPRISIDTDQSIHKYSMSQTFNLLTPTDDVKITADDSEDGDLTSKIELKNVEVIKEIGKQSLHYVVTDSDGNTANQYLDIEVTK